MKLLTEFSKVGNRLELHVPGNRMAVDDEAVERDAFAAHALVLAMEEYDWYLWERNDNPVAIVKRRAAELMCEWGFEEKVTP